MKKTLLCGISKAGNSKARFIIFNYFNILNNNATKTLTWEELERPHLLRIEQGADNGNYNDGFPNVHHTHVAYDGQDIITIYPNYSQKYFEKFDILIYFYRNPFDTAISYYHFVMDRVNNPLPFGAGLVGKELKECRTLDGFAKWFLPKWIHHIKTTMSHADLVIDYDKNDPNDYRKALELITDNNVNEVIFQRALEMSSFNNIKQMGDSVKQPWGLGNSTMTVPFCRDGRTGQFAEMMSVQTIHYFIEECSKNGIKISYFVDEIMKSLDKNGTMGLME